MPSGQLVWSSLYKALSPRIRASWTDPGHFTTQFVMMRSALSTNWMLMLCLSFRLIYPQSLSWGAWICTWVQSITPIVLGMFPKKNLCLVLGNLVILLKWNKLIDQAGHHSQFICPLLYGHQQLGRKSQMHRSTDQWGPVLPQTDCDYFGFSI